MQGIITQDNPMGSPLQRGEYVDVLYADIDFYYVRALDGHTWYVPTNAIDIDAEDTSTKARVAALEKQVEEMTRAIHDMLGSPTPEELNAWLVRTRRIESDD